MTAAGRRASAASSARAGPRTRSWPNWHPIQERRGQYEADPNLVQTFCETEQNRATARRADHGEVREAMHLMAAGETGE